LELRHGVGRGRKMRLQHRRPAGWNQNWRKPLREALDSWDELSGVSREGREDIQKIGKQERLYPWF